MSRDHRAFAQKLRADAALLDDMARSLRLRADEVERTALPDPATAREAERSLAIRESLTGGYVGLLRDTQDLPE